MSKLHNPENENKQILHISDDESTRVLTRMVLKKLGYHDDNIASMDFDMAAHILKTAPYVPIEVMLVSGATKGVPLVTNPLLKKPGIVILTAEDKPRFPMENVIYMPQPISVENLSAALATGRAAKERSPK